MKKTFYCTAFKGENQISLVYKSKNEACEAVIQYIIEWSDHILSWDEAHEICEKNSYWREKLGYGIIKLESESEEGCYDQFI